MKTIFYLPPTSLKFNFEKQSILKSTPKNYEKIKSNIQNVGILEPLLVHKDTSVVISGNVRLQISIEIGLNEVPVIFCDDSNIDMLKVISTDVTREKTLEERYSIHVFMTNILGIKQGQRTDLFPEKKENQKILNEMSPSNKSEINRINRLKKHHGEEKTDKIIKEIDIGNTTINKEIEKLNDSFQIKDKKENKSVVNPLNRIEMVIPLDSLFENDTLDKIMSLNKEGSIIVRHNSSVRYAVFYKKIREFKMELFNQYMDRHGVIFYHLIFKNSRKLPELELGEIIDIEDVIRQLDYPVKQVA